MEEIRNFPRYLAFKDRTYSVAGYLDETTSYKDNKGYVDKSTGRIYICAKYDDPIHNDVPIVYVDSETDAIIDLKDCSNSMNLEKFHINNCYSLSVPDLINSTTGDEELYNEAVLADMNASSSSFCPTINDDDDALKKIIKQIIIDKQIDLSRLKHKMPQKYGLTNMKSALIGTTKMSITNFNIWCELLGVNYTITISDNGGDKIDPLPSSLEYNSSTSSITPKF